MIRINLLPVKKAKKRATGQRQVLLFAAGLGVELVCIMVFHMNESWKVREKLDRNSRSKDVIARLKADVGNYEEIKAQRDDLVTQREAINKLKAGRTGPVYVLRELSEILTQDKGPTYSKEDYVKRMQTDPNAGYNPSWDPRRIWVTGWHEASRRVLIEGMAKSNDDVAEFMKRLQLSVFFADVVLEGTRQTTGADSSGGITYAFKINCSVRY
ncbi:MAG TPA: PilN domain-containing protein [Polyangia bacterium]|nr:PilN domain-containing protein [Polyangia bacterium]